MRKCFFVALILCLFAGPLPAQDWTVLRFGGLDYVTLSSFCNFYQLPYDSPISNDVFRAKNGQMSVELHRDSREVKINGVRFWLSFGVLQLGHDWVISKLDLIKVFEPILRPQMLDNKRVIHGVVIDPGHGGGDQGATSQRGKMEKNYTLDTAFRLEKILRASGLKVVMTRRSDVFIELYERARIANKYPDYLFVSIHFNQASEEARGLETYACSPRAAASTQAGGRVSSSDFHSMPGNANDPMNALLAYEVQRQIIKLNPGDNEADRGVKRARFVVIKQNTLPGILVEGGFLSSHLESAMLDQTSYRQHLAEDIGQGIMNFIDKVSPVPKPEQSRPAPVPPATPVTPGAAGTAVTPAPTRPTTADTGGAAAVDAAVKAATPGTISPAPVSPTQKPSFGPVIQTNIVTPPPSQPSSAIGRLSPSQVIETPPATIIYGQGPVKNGN